MTGRAQDTAGQAARVMYHRGLKLLPVADEAGRLAGIVSRTDALAIFAGWMRRSAWSSGRDDGQISASGALVAGCRISLPSGW